MPIYRLSPVDGQTSDPRWEASILREACWIQADTTDSARHRVEMETAVVVAFRADRPTPSPPWKSSRLVKCEELAPQFDVREGQIVLEDGKVF